MNETQIFCQECGKVEDYGNMQKVSNEGWICFQCLEEWRKPSDVY